MPTTSTPTDPTKSSLASREPAKEGGAGVGTPAAPRIQVRERKAAETLTAYQLTKEADVILPSGHGIRAYPGEWVVCRNDRVVDTLSAARFQQFYEPIGDPAFVLAPADRTTLEKILGFGTTRDSSTLTGAVSRLAVLSIGDVTKNFTVTQWEEIARRAEKRRMTVPQYMEHLVEKLLQDLWTTAI